MEYDNLHIFDPLDVEIADDIDYDYTLEEIGVDITWFDEDGEY